MYIYFADLEQNPEALEYISVDKKGKFEEALNYNKDQTQSDKHKIPPKLQNEICLKFIEKDSMNLQYIKNQTEELCIRAVEKYGTSLKFVINQTEKICLKTIKKWAPALQYVKNQTRIFVWKLLNKMVMQYNM